MKTHEWMHFFAAASHFIFAFSQAALVLGTSWAIAAGEATDTKMPVTRAELKSLIKVFTPKKADLRGGYYHRYRRRVSCPHWPPLTTHHFFPSFFR
jgi:hypothetical protein